MRGRGRGRSRLTRQTVSSASRRLHYSSFARCAGIRTPHPYATLRGHACRRDHLRAAALRPALRSLPAVRPPPTARLSDHQRLPPKPTFPGRDGSGYRPSDSLTSDNEPLARPNTSSSSFASLSRRLAGKNARQKKMNALRSTRHPVCQGSALAMAAGTALAFLPSRPASCPPSTSRFPALICHAGCVGSAHNQTIWPIAAQSSLRPSVPSVRPLPSATVRARLASVCGHIVGLCSLPTGRIVRLSARCTGTRTDSPLRFAPGAHLRSAHLRAAALRAGGRLQRRARNPIRVSGGPAANHLFRLFHRRFAPQNRPRPRPGRRWADGFVAAAIPKYADITMPGARRPMLSRCARSRAFPPPSRAARLPRASSPRCGPLARPNRRRRRLSRRAEGRSTNTRAILSARNTCLPKPETTKYRWKTSGNEAILKTD